MDMAIRLLILAILPLPICVAIDWAIGAAPYGPWKDLLAVFPFIGPAVVVGFSAWLLGIWGSENGSAKVCALILVVLSVPLTLFLYFLFLHDVLGEKIILL